MAHELTYEEIQMCKKVFDTNKIAILGDNAEAKITIEGSMKALCEMEFNLSEEEVREILSNMNIEVSKIDFPSFLRVAATKFKQREFLQAICDAFKAFDKKNKGYLTYEEVKHVLIDHGPKLAPDEAENLLQELRISPKEDFEYTKFVKDNI